MLVFSILSFQGSRHFAFCILWEIKHPLAQPNRQLPTLQA